MDNVPTNPFKFIAWVIAVFFTVLWEKITGKK